MYHECEMSYVIADTHDADLDPFFYSGSYMDVHHSDASCPLDDVVIEVLDGLGSYGDNETDDEEPLHS